MGLSKIRVTSEDPVIEAFLASTIGENLLKPVMNAKAKDLKSLLNLSSAHEECLSLKGITRRERCNGCGKEVEGDLKRVLVDTHGTLVEKQDAVGGVFQVIAKSPASSLDIKWVEKTYFIDTDGQVGAELASALKNYGLIGYIRMQKNSEERPAALVSTEEGVLAFVMLYYYDTETNPAIPYYNEVLALQTQQLEFLLTDIPTISPADVAPREYLSLKAELEKNHAEGGANVNQDEA